MLMTFILQDDDDDGKDRKGDGEVGTGKAEDHLAMEDDPADEDYGTNVRKSLRRRKSSMKVRMLLGKRKRGRPPNLTDHPVSCSTCGETFIVAKDYKQHLVSVKN
jgi:hypothetical protein